MADAPLPAALSTRDFEYDLPTELIAQEPPAERGTSRLLHLDRASGSLTDRTFAELAALIPSGDLLCLNTTRVRHARLLGARVSGAPAEVLLLEPLTGGEWLAMGKPGSALQPGKVVMLTDAGGVRTVRINRDGTRVVEFIGMTADAAMQQCGRLPLPPYIRRSPDEADEQRYQTVYAEREGSVAAPTAGLHFTARLLDDLASRGVRVATLDLHVGPGTFRPVDADDPARHEMHEEQFSVPEETAALIDRTHAAGHQVWAVGTTVVRALESASDVGGRVHPGHGATRLMIAPGYQFKVVDRLITNFHLPRSTLLMLVSAFAGQDRTRAAYRHAVQERYRFYSYGDAMAIT